MGIATLPGNDQLNCDLRRLKPEASLLAPAASLNSLRPQATATCFASHRSTTKSPTVQRVTAGFSRVHRNRWRDSLRATNQSTGTKVTRSRGGNDEAVRPAAVHQRLTITTHDSATPRSLMLPGWCPDL